MTYVAIVLFATVWVLLYFMRKDTFNRGKDEKEKEAMNEVIDDVHLAKIVRDKLRADSDVAGKLRNKYTRK